MAADAIPGTEAGEMTDLEIYSATLLGRGFLEPVIERLSRHWIGEEEATKGMRLPHSRLFWLAQLGLIERRRHGWLWNRKWQIRLSEQGWRPKEPERPSGPTYWGRDLGKNPLPAKAKTP